MIRTTSSVSSLTSASVSSPPLPARGSAARVALSFSQRAKPRSPLPLRVGERARLVDHLQQVRRYLLALRLQHRELHEPRRVEHRPHEFGQRRAWRIARELPQRPQRRRHRRNPRVARPQVVEPPAAAPVQEQILVGAPERRRSQRRHRRDPVCRIVDRPQHGDQLAHLLPHEERTPAFVPVRHQVRANASS